MPNMRLCVGCGKQGPYRSMIRTDTRKGGKIAYLHPGCSLPPPKICLACDLPVYSGLFCHTHGERWRRWGKPPVEEWVAAFLENRLNTCQVCGRQWNGYHGCRNCSPECLKVYKAGKSLKRWRSLSPEEQKQAVDRRLAQLRERTLARYVDLSCVICGAAFRHLPGRKLCGSRACKRKYNRQAQDECRRLAALGELLKISQQMGVLNGPNHESPTPGGNPGSDTDRSGIHGNGPATQ